MTEAAVQLLKKKEKEAVKKGRPTKNPVWSLFRRVNGKSVMCSLCYKIVKSACATNMSKHLGRHHSEYTTTTVTQPRKEYVGLWDKDISVSFQRAFGIQALFLLYRNQTAKEDQTSGTFFGNRFRGRTWVVPKGSWNLEIP